MSHGVRQALLHAAQRLATPYRAPTLRELADAAGVPLWQARWAVPDLKRAGKLHIARKRHAAYRPGPPVAEYAPGPVPQGAATHTLTSVMHAWAARA